MTSLYSHLYIEQETDQEEAPEVPSYHNLDPLLKSYNPIYTFNQPYPRLLDVSYDITDHCLNVSHRKKMRAVCILSDLHSVLEEQLIDAYAQEFEMSPEDYEEIYGAHPNCIRFKFDTNRGTFKVLAHLFASVYFFSFTNDILILQHNRLFSLS